jgi:hypothetical protein
VLTEGLPTFNERLGKKKVPGLFVDGKPAAK